MTGHLVHHAVEITLTRPAAPGEIRHARHRVPLAANADRTRLMVVHSAHGPGRALHGLRRRLGPWLPIDVLTTHYPDRHGQVLLNVDLDSATHEVLCRDASALGQRPQDVLGRRVRAALDRDARERAERLEDRLASLLAHHTPEEVLASAARRVGCRHHRCAPPAP
ncbi:hypothetical protein EJ357_47590 [Streptomyces cyaneochromogenes]|uniref:Uncharacterized protein n=1 Tax=Streptomyces cyaneochromogenes TaxID=2496836 RepID=A0A3Q9ENM9_9ACTN|nr:hypothetical protein [Streptomyces cyaneochromogenes]AZQ32126.1 hypothetical protein EJ357_00340 [Streptomyces cyaneochromogenes]AZQ40097.1 hypothetical protein EJ357_47590 [Streptomyces cyaneochromogenes]